MPRRSFSSTRAASSRRTRPSSFAPSRSSTASCRATGVRCRRLPTRASCDRASCCSPPASSTTCRPLTASASCMDEACSIVRTATAGKCAINHSRSTDAARAGYGLALELTAWSTDLMLCTDGPTEIDAGRPRPPGAQWNRGSRGARRTARRERRHPHARRVRGRRAPCAPRAVLHHRAVSALRSVRAPRVRVQRKGDGPHREVRDDAPRGSYVAGDASRAVQWVVVAAAEGAEAAFAINTDLIQADLK